MNNLNISWFKEEDNLIYVDGLKPLDFLAKEFRIKNFEEELLSFKANPTKEGKTVYGEKRSSVKFFIPDLTFDEHIEMGENIFVYSGVLNPCYVIYFPLEK